MNDITTIIIQAFGKKHLFKLPIKIVYKKLRDFEMKHFGLVEFEIFSVGDWLLENRPEYLIFIHTKGGML